MLAQPPSDVRPLRAGSAQVITFRDRAVVSLSGEVDLVLAPLLDDLAEQVIAGDREVVIDVAAVTFCDLTFAGFVSALSAAVCVTVRRPSRAVRDLLVLTGLASVVQMDQGGGPRQKV